MSKPVSMSFLGAQINDHNLDGVDIRSDASRATIAQAVTKLFELWDLNTDEQLLLLGLSPKNRASLVNYKKGSPLPNTADLLDRAGHLLSIHKSLRILFPHDRDIVYGWIKYPNKVFKGLSPLQVMIDYRMVGLVKVRLYLDKARGQ